MKINPSDEDGDYILFGKIALLWGHVEGPLTNIVLRLLHPLFNPPPGLRISSNFAPMKKLAIRRYREIPQMVSLAQEAEILFESLEPLHKQRTIIVHGQYQGFTGADRFMFGLYHSRKNERHRFSFYAFSHSDLVDLLTAIESARQKMKALSDDTFAIEPPKPPRAAKRSRNSS